MYISTKQVILDVVLRAHEGIPYREIFNAAKIDMKHLSAKSTKRRIQQAILSLHREGRIEKKKVANGEDRWISAHRYTSSKKKAIERLVKYMDKMKGGEYSIPMRGS